MGQKFHLFKKKRKINPETIVELVIDTPVFELLKKQALGKGVSENDEFVHALRRGMKDYWLHVAKHEEERYEEVEKLFAQSKRDNEILDAIINQNERFRGLLKDQENNGESNKGQ